MHFSVSGHVTLGVVWWCHELIHITSLWLLSKFGPVEAHTCRVIANLFSPSNGIKRYLNGPLRRPNTSWNILIRLWSFEDCPKMNSWTTVVPTFHCGRSGFLDHGIFCIDCHLETIPATGTVGQANVSCPSTDTLGHEATASTGVVQNLSPLWTQCWQG